MSSRNGTDAPADQTATEEDLPSPMDVAIVPVGAAGSRLTNIDRRDFSTSPTLAVPDTVMTEVGEDASDAGNLVS